MKMSGGEVDCFKGGEERDKRKPGPAVIHN